MPGEVTSRVPALLSATWLRATSLGAPAPLLRRLQLVPGRVALGLGIAVARPVTLRLLSFVAQDGILAAQDVELPLELARGRIAGLALPCAARTAAPAHL